MHMCCVVDLVAGAWMNPLFFQSPAQAVRSFQDAVMDKGSEFGKHPADYVLMRIGTFDPSDGKVDLLDVPERLVMGANLVQEGVQ